MLTGYCDTVAYFQVTTGWMSNFLQLTEQIQRFSDPSGGNSETARLRSASALSNLLPAFEECPLRISPPLMRYGHVNALNAALTLLQGRPVNCSDHSPSEARGMR